MSLQILTYQSTNAPAHKAWIAYPVLDGLWLVRCEAATEAAAIERAKAWYEAEKVRQARIVGKSDDEGNDFKPAAVPSVGSGRGLHFAGKVWMVNRETGHKCRIMPELQGSYEAKGYVRGGPRS